MLKPQAMIVSDTFISLRVISPDKQITCNCFWTQTAIVVKVRFLTC